MTISKKAFLRILLGGLIVMGGMISSCKPATAIVAHDIIVRGDDNYKFTKAAYEFLEERCPAFKNLRKTIIDDQDSSSGSPTSDGMKRINRLKKHDFLFYFELSSGGRMTKIFNRGKFAALKKKASHVFVVDVRDKTSWNAIKSTDIPSINENVYHLACKNMDCENKDCLLHNEKVVKKLCEDIASYSSSLGTEQEEEEGEGERRDPHSGMTFEQMMQVTRKQPQRNIPQQVTPPQFQFPPGMRIPRATRALSPEEKQVEILSEIMVSHLHRLVEIAKEQGNQGYIEKLIQKLNDQNQEYEDELERISKE